MFIRQRVLICNIMQVVRKFENVTYLDSVEFSICLIGKVKLIMHGPIGIHYSICLNALCLLTFFLCDKFHFAAVRNQVGII